MSVYMLLDAEVHDPEKYEEYKAVAAAICRSTWRRILLSWR